MRVIFRATFLSAIFSFLPIAAMSQGTLSFQNSTSTRVIDICTGLPLPTGDPGPFTAGLYWSPEGAVEDSLALLTTTRVWGPFSGMFNGGTATFPVPGGTSVLVQVRVWSSAYASYEAALASGNADANPGKGIVQALVLGGAGSPPSPPQSLTNPTQGGVPFAGFYVGPLTCIPEPKAIAIAIGALLAFIGIRSRHRERVGK